MKKRRLSRLTPTIDNDKDNDNAKDNAKDNDNAKNRDESSLKEPVRQINRKELRSVYSEPT